MLEREDGMRLKPPSSIADQIATHLEGEILRGKYRNGEHLQQDEICRYFQVSRTPTREALRKLQALGLVSLVPNRGAMVRRPTLEDLREVYDVRAELEGYATALAAERGSPQFVRDLRRVQTVLTSTLHDVERDAGEDDSYDGGPLKDFNDRFHKMVHSAAGNQRLREMIENLERYFPKDTVFRAITLTADLQQFYVTEHEHVIDAIAAGDPDAARDSMKVHIAGAQGRLLAYLRDIGYEQD